MIICFANPLCHQLLLSPGPWLHFKYLKSPFWTVTSRTFWGRTPGTTVFTKKNLASRAWEHNGTSLYKQQSCWGIQFTRPLQLMQSNLPLKAVLSQVSCGFT